MNLYNRNSKNIAKWWYSLDHNIIFSFIMLLLVGLIMSKSASTNVAEKIGLDALYFYHKHILFVILAILAALFFSLLKPHIILRFSLLLLLLSLMLVVIIIFTEDHTKGAKRWLRIAGLTIQPSEFIKPFFIVINAWFLSRKFVRDDINGYIVNIGDADNLAKKITKLIISPEIRKDFGKKVRQVAESKLDLKICADLHEQAYQVLTNND